MIYESVNGQSSQVLIFKYDNLLFGFIDNQQNWKSQYRKDLLKLPLCLFLHPFFIDIILSTFQ